MTTGGEMGSVGLREGSLQGDRRMRWMQLAGEAGGIGAAAPVVGAVSKIIAGWAGLAMQAQIGHGMRVT